MHVLDYPYDLQPPRHKLHTRSDLIPLPCTFCTPKSQIRRGGIWSLNGSSHVWPHSEQLPELKQPLDEHDKRDWVRSTRIPKEIAEGRCHPSLDLGAGLSLTIVHRPCRVQLDNGMDQHSVCWTWPIPALCGWMHIAAAPLRETHELTLQAFSGLTAGDGGGSDVVSFSISAVCTSTAAMVL